MGLKGYRLWVMGQLDSMCRAPPHAVDHPLEQRDRGLVVLVLHLRFGARGAFQVVHEHLAHAREEHQHQRGVTRGRYGRGGGGTFLGFLVVAVQVAFKRQTLKPVFSLDRL